MISRRLAQIIIDRNKALLNRHRMGGPEWFLSDEKIQELEYEIEQAQRAMSMAEDEEADMPYERNDPKCARYSEEMRDAADLERDTDD